MAGTKEKPCSQCKFGNFEIWLKQEEDICYQCNSASNWTQNIKEDLFGDEAEFIGSDIGNK